VIVGASSPEEKTALVAYLAGKIGISSQQLIGAMPYEVGAITRKGLPLGAVIYINYRGPTVEMACAGEPGWLSPGTIRDAFTYPFVQLGVWTVLTHTSRNNAASRKFQRKLGFRELGVVECGPNRNDDAIIYSMTRPECRWIEQPTQARAA